MYTEKEACEYLQTLYTAVHRADPFAYRSQEGLGSSWYAGERAPFVVFSSAPGRVELAGNHTDHQGGRTISAAIIQRTYALAVPNDSDDIHVFMDGFGDACVALSDLESRSDEKGTSLSLIRGMAAAYVQSGKELCGFNMVTCSDIPAGRGLSSSAAFEVLTGAVLRGICDSTGQAPTRELMDIALQGVWVEQHYFGKPCGAQDQLASAYGGVVAMDFAEVIPCVNAIDTTICASPYSLFLIDSRSDHSHCIDEFAAIPADMYAVAQYFDCARLEDVPYQRFLDQLQAVRARLGDRATLRALHYFEETRRVLLQQQALKECDYEMFLKLVRLSGASSAQFLQNVSPCFDKPGGSQPVMTILALCAHLLDGENATDKNHLRGAYRIHGGGFGGSVLAFVSSQKADEFQVSMNTLLGYDACMPVAVDARGVCTERLA